MGKTSNERKYLKTARKLMQRPYLFHAQDRNDAAMYLAGAVERTFDPKIDRHLAYMALQISQDARRAAKVRGHKLP